MSRITKKLVITVCLIFALFLPNTAVFAYKNYMTLPNQSAIGDPFIMKYNGTYYLYTSTGTNFFECWSSTNTVDWRYEGKCAPDNDILFDGYAPEVVYWNGTFYMYTSPRGQGHYVLTSTSPTGPFTVVTGNLGHSIDGHVFIEDNGSWYFLSAGGDGIHSAPMSSPTSIGNDMLLSGTQVSGQWTEAPTLIKRNGTYYLTETGNHVISPSYRVNLSTNTTGPQSAFTPSNQNPILVNTEGGTNQGTGHNGMYIGPDLDTYYVAYHNFIPPSGRYLNLEAVGWNGDKMVVYGPTTWEMQNPAAPDFEDRFQRADVGDGYSNNGGTWETLNDFLYQNATGSSVSSIVYENTFTTASDYTAEYNVQEVASGNTTPKIGAVYGYVDADNYGVAIINGETKQLETKLLVDHVWSTPVYTSLPAGFDSTKLHTIRIEKSGTTYKYFVDGLLKETKTDAGLGAGKVGYLTSDTAGKFGYIAASNKVNGSGIFDFYKPIPGTIQAVHYNSGGEGVGYHDTTNGNEGGKYIRNDNVDISDNPEGGENISSNTEGEWYKYNVNVQADGTYNVGIRYRTTATNAKVKISFDSTAVTSEVDLPSTAGNWQTYDIKGLNLTAGNHTIKVETVSGDFDLYTLQFYKANNSAIHVLDNFDGGYGPQWNYSDGNWTNPNSAAAEINRMGKRTLGSTGWSDYTVEANIAGIDGLNSGIMVRVQNPSQGGANDSPDLGTDFYQGYVAILTPGGVGLGKQNFNWTPLATAAGTYNLGTYYHMKVVVSGNNIKVYVEDMETPKIDYTDNVNPFIHGKVGLRSHNTISLFDDFSVTQLGDTEGYPLTFQSATGGTVAIGESKNYPAEDRVAISAVAKVGYRFDHWTSSNGGSFANENSATTIFTMPDHSTTVTANFVEMPIEELAGINYALGKNASSNDSISIGSVWNISNLTNGLKTLTGYSSVDHAYAETGIFMSVDLGQDTQIDTVKLYPRTDITNPGGVTVNYPENFEIQVKANGASSFSTVKTVTNEPEPHGAPKEYILDTPVSAKDVRIVVTKLGIKPISEDHRLQLNEMEVYNKSDSVATNYALGRSVSSNDSLQIPGAWGAERITDGNVNTTGSTSEAYSNPDLGIYVAVDLGQDTFIDTVKLYPRGDMTNPGGVTVNYPENFEIQVKASGASGFTTVRTVTNEPQPAG